jgi:stearoyl-CoA desaturase (delta-9 desaturase)
MDTIFTLMLLVFVMLQVSMLCSRIYLHCFLSHRAIVSLHPGVATAMHLWLAVLIGIDPKKWMWKHRDHHNYKKRDPYNPYGKGQWSVFVMTWLYYAKGKPGPTDAIDYCPNWVDSIPLIGYMGISGLVALVSIGALISPWSGIWIGAAVWSSHLFLFTMLFSALNAFAHEDGGRDGGHGGAVNVWWLSPFTWGENFHKNHHARPRIARFAKSDPAWPIIRLLELCQLADANSSLPGGNAADRKPRLRGARVQ